MIDIDKVDVVALEEQQILADITNVLDKHNIDSHHRALLFGSDPKDMQINAVEAEVLAKFSRFLSIDRSLNIIFNNPELIYGYLQMINDGKPYCGQTPLDFIVQSNENLIEVDNTLGYMAANGFW